MELNKYYIPETDEFNTSFLWEVRDGKNWFSREGYPLQLFELLKNNEIRVKYLDREDIESLGFTDKDLNIPTKFSFYKKVKDNKIYEIKTYWDMVKNERENLIRIFKGTLHNYPYTEIFRGNIKNKSELKKLMNQLGINDTK